MQLDKFQLLGIITFSLISIVAVSLFDNGE